VTAGDAPIAALDVGSNTIRLVAARPSGDGLETVLDLGSFARLGMGVERTGELDPTRVDTAVQTIRGYVDLARALGIRQIIAVATSAVRDARNGPEFVDRVREVAGVDLQIISGEREAELTYLGATLGLSWSGTVVVVDLGGGSGEIIAADESGLRWGHALPLGSGRMSERFVRHDPPLRDEIDAVRAHVRDQLESLPAVDASSGVFAGGTARRIPALLGRAEVPTDLDRAELDAALEIVLATPADELVARYGVEPERAPVLPAGCAVLAAIADYYALPTVRIAATGIRQGMLVERFRQLGQLPE
jgi:exopolyphosphatase/guanosine-5'-triphosphate,3'-diphosphate pyrophosphatase